MKKILVPIDFSNNSHNAYLFARDLSATIDGKLHLVHIYPGKNEEWKPLIRYEEELEETKKRLTSFTNRYPASGNVITKINMEVEVIYGFSASKSITDLSENYDLIIMGTRKEHSLKDNILGSVASSVAQNANCPVLLVPKGAHFGGFNNMIYASNWESADKKVVGNLLYWALLFDAKIDFTHVSPEYEIKDFGKVKEEIQEHLFELMPPFIEYTFSNIADDSTMRGIHRYAKEKAADLIAVGNRQRKFWNNLFFTSLTKEIALHIQVPLLVFHIPDAEL